MTWVGLALFSWKYGKPTKSAFLMQRTTNSLCEQLRKAYILELLEIICVFAELNKQSFFIKKADEIETATY